jgi:hypothetical protein
MAGHAYVNQVQDPAAQKAILNALGLITQLTTRIVALEAAALQNTATIDAKDQRIVNVAPPSADADVVNLATLRAYVASQVETF